jgi:hypothetical protein
MSEDSSPRIPTVDPDLPPGNGGAQKSREELEYRLLESEADLKGHLSHEAGQRVTVKWIAVVTAVLVVLFMAISFCLVIYRVFYDGFTFSNTGFAVAVIAAPVISLTTIAVALLVLTPPPKAP